jgi:hypothetical protein
MSKEHLLMEVKKLLNILETWGNCLVPSFENGKETSAEERLIYVIGELQTKFNMSLEDIHFKIGSRLWNRWDRKNKLMEVNKI